MYFWAEEEATYYVAAGADRDGEGTYTLSVRDVTDTFTDDFATDTGTSGAAEVGVRARGKIEFEGDRDWFAVELEAGKSYLIDLKGSETWSGTLGDPYLRGVHDTDGVLIAGTTNDDGGEGYNSRVYFTAEEGGTYYVAAGGYEGSEGTYRLSVAEATDDFAAGTGTSGAVAVGGPATGEIEKGGDRDWFAVELEAGRAYRIDLEGHWTGAGSLYDPYLYGVHDTGGDLIAGTTDDRSGVVRNSRVTFTAAEDATYYVAAGADGDGEGTYTLSVREVPDDFVAATGTSGAVEVGGSATGEIDFLGDRDWFAVTLEAGRIYRIDLEGHWTGAGTLYDPYLYGVYDADGVRFAGTTNDDGGEGYNNSPGGFYAGGCRRLLCGGRRLLCGGRQLERVGRHLHAVGGRGHVTCAAPARAGCGTSSSPATTISATRHSGPGLEIVRVAARDIRHRQRVGAFRKVLAVRFGHTLLRLRSGHLAVVAGTPVIVGFSSRTGEPRTGRGDSVALPCTLDRFPAHGLHSRPTLTSRCPSRTAH